MGGSATHAERPPTGRSPSAALFFDGECGICTWFASAAARIDRRGRFDLVPYQDLARSALACYRLTPADCAQRLYVVEPWPAWDAPTSEAPGSFPTAVPARAPRTWGGARGINVFLWRSFPWSLAVVILYGIPLFFLGEVLVYRWVARHRVLLSRRFGLRACRVPPRRGDAG